MTIALALLTREGILLAADNGNYLDDEKRLEETAQKIFAWPRQGIAFMHAGVAGRTVGSQHLEIRDSLKEFMQSMPIIEVEPVRKTASSLFNFIYKQWRDFLRDDLSDKPDKDEIELLIAGYDKGAPVCAILDVYHRLDKCKQKYYALIDGLLVPVRLAPRVSHRRSISAISTEESSADERLIPLLTLGGREGIVIVNEILGLPNSWPENLPYPTDITSALSKVYHPTSS
jgi:hypothetical protein